ncbi:MAG: S-adenosyl-L-methionine-binding protein [Methanosaeta sp. PtaU1.Bin112]|nr:MAG: S-adenosyl-L-methionine-binding protein [Methanosaeta sp. PtaU1.Bin112]
MSQNAPLNSMIFVPIGYVTSKYDKPGDPKALRNSESTLVLDKKYIRALDGLEKCRYIQVIFFFHHSKGYHERVHPMGDRSIPKRGVLATRSPCRPNPIGITVAEIHSVESNIIRVKGLDALNGTPILDIKPYEEHFDSYAGVDMEKDPGYRPVDSLSKKMSKYNCDQSIPLK